DERTVSQFTRGVVAPGVRASVRRNGKRVRRARGGADDSMAIETHDLDGGGHTLRAPVPELAGDVAAPPEELAAGPRRQRVLKAGRQQTSRAGFPRDCRRVHGALRPASRARWQPHTQSDDREPPPHRPGPLGHPRHISSAPRLDPFSAARLEPLTTGRTVPLRRTRNVPAPDPATSVSAIAIVPADRCPCVDVVADGPPTDVGTPTEDVVVGCAVGPDEGEAWAPFGVEDG